MTEKPGSPQSTGSQSWTLPKQPCAQRRKAFFTCSNTSPVRVEPESDVASWLVGTLVAPSVQRYRLPLLQELWPFWSLFSSLL